MEPHVEQDRFNGTLPERIFRVLEDGKMQLQVAVKECDKPRETIGIMHDINRVRIAGVTCDILELRHPETIEAQKLLLMQ